MRRLLQRARTGATPRGGVAHTFQVIPPNDYQPLSLTTRYPVVGYCPAGDPGHTVNVSPVEPSPRGVMRRHT